MASIKITKNIITEKIMEIMLMHRMKEMSRTDTPKETELLRMY